MKLGAISCLILVFLDFGGFGCLSNHSQLSFSLTLHLHITILRKKKAQIKPIGLPDHSQLQDIPISSALSKIPEGSILLI